jgi:CBS domain-containing protein
MLKASEVMTGNVITASPGMPIREAVQMMVSNHFSGLPVVDEEGRICGVLTEGDLLRRAELGTERKTSRLMALLMPGRAAEQYVHDRARTVGDVMSRGPVCAGANTTIDEIVDLMDARQIKRIPVVGRGKLIGIVSRSDILRALLAASSESENAMTDAGIRHWRWPKSKSNIGRRAGAPILR